MTVHLTNDYTEASGVATEISGSPFAVTILPGEVYPPLCYTDISGSQLTQTNLAYSFNIFFRDEEYNLHYKTMNDEIAAGLVVSVTFDYVNHDNYPSPLGIADDSDWQSIYGTSHAGTLTDNNDGSMTASVTILRAGTYLITVQVDGIDVIGSPYEHLEIEPTSILPSNCVADGIEASMTAGYDYTFRLQARDQYNSNLPKTLSEAVGTDHSVLVSLATNSADNFSATLSDYSSYGAYLISIDVPKAQTAGTYDFTVMLGGQ